MREVLKSEGTEAVTLVTKTPHKPVLDSFENLVKQDFNPTDFYALGSVLLCGFA